MTDLSKRRFLTTGMTSALAATVGTSASAATLQKETTPGAKTRFGVPLKSARFANSLDPEFCVDKDSVHTVTFNPHQRLAFQTCMGCWSLCGVRVRLDRESGEVLRSAGNPFNPLAMHDPLSYDASFDDMARALSEVGDNSERGTICARGNALMALRESPLRVTSCLKRVGPRGSGKWKSIAYEELIREIVEGGDLFGEGPVEGLRSIRDLDTLIDPQAPEWGPKANQLLVSNASQEGRDDILKRFAFNSFGTRNLGNHGAYCGYSFRAGYAAMLSDFAKNPNMKPDIDNAEFVLYIGTAPAQSGNPFVRQARMLAHRRIDKDFSFKVVTPSLPMSTTVANGINAEWVPIHPASDSAFVLGLMHWLFDNDGINLNFLSQPSDAAAKKAGELVSSNATHLVVVSEGALKGKFLRLEDLDASLRASFPQEADAKTALCVNRRDALSLASIDEPAVLFAERTVLTSSGEVQVKTAISILREEVRAKTLDEYAAICGVPATRLIEIAKQFKAHGRKSVVDTHGGTMHANGFYDAFGIVTLNVLAGNLCRKGGSFMKPKAWAATGAGPRYDFVHFPGKVAPKGCFIGRTKVRWESSSEAKRRKAQGQSLYPAPAPFYPVSNPLIYEELAGAMVGYPYKLKAWINHIGNPLYGVPGLEKLVGEKLKDPANLGLFVCVDAFISETSALADYIVPDTVNYETWGMVPAWHGVPTRNMMARWPIAAPKTAKTADGRAICLENFLIDLAKTMGLPGFGKEAMKDAQGNLLDIDSAESYYLRAMANTAFDAQPVQEASEAECHITGSEDWGDKLQAYLKPEEIKRVLTVMNRGGRFEATQNAYKGDAVSARYSKPISIFNETLAGMRHAITGESMKGTAALYTPRFADGRAVRDIYTKKDWPLSLISYKSHVHSSVTSLSEKLCAIRADNPVFVNTQDAQMLGIQSGDSVRLSTPGGELETRVWVTHGVMPGTVAVEHGYGHWELGVRAHEIDGQTQKISKYVEHGVNLNRLGILDPTREKVPGILVDWVVGSAARQGLPAKIERL